MKVYQKLNAARKQFHTLQLKKTGFNKFAGYPYFELGDFLIPALNVFEQNGLCAFISFGKDLATMSIIDVDDGCSICLTSPMAEAQLKGCHPIQNLGAVETYTRRYLWLAALEIVEHDALDSSAPLEVGRKGNAPIIPASPPTEELNIDPETLKFLNELTVEVELMCSEGKAQEARNTIKAAGLDNDQLIALNNMIGSKSRTAMKKAREAERHLLDQMTSSA